MVHAGCTVRGNGRRATGGKGNEGGSGGEGRTREREKRGMRARRIRYLSRRCCVQVNKLTRRRASAIFFPINLNLLLTLFPCFFPALFPRPVRPFPPHVHLSLPRLCDSLFPAAIFRSLRPSLSSPSTRPLSYSFLISRSRPSSFLRSFPVSLFLPVSIYIYLPFSLSRVSAASSG